jgi:hypothetical protein
LPIKENENPINIVTSENTPKLAGANSHSSRRLDNIDNQADDINSILEELERSRINRKLRFQNKYGY